MTLAFHRRPASIDSARLDSGHGSPTIASRISTSSGVIFGLVQQSVGGPRLATKAARVFRDASVVVLPRTGHVAQMEHPGLVAARFREMVGRTQGMPDNAIGLSPDGVPST